MEMSKAEILVATSADFTLLRGERPVAVRAWDDVAVVRAFKRDEITTDLIYLALTMRDGSEFLAYEDTPGWEDFLEAAEAALPGFPRATEWMPQVARPAFERNEKILFER